LPLGVFYGDLGYFTRDHLVHFVLIWYIFFPLLVSCTKINLATLITTAENELSEYWRSPFARTNVKALFSPKSFLPEKEKSHKQQSVGVTQDNATFYGSGLTLDQMNKKKEQKLFPEKNDSTLS
jgi:hypothetical protein